MKKLTLLLFILLSTYIFSQFTVSGKVLDEKGNELPYVSIYDPSSNIGTTSNEEGYYAIEVPKAQPLTLHYQFLGYNTHIEQINADKNKNITVRLKSQQLVLDKVLISSKSNPALNIIKKAIQAREKNTKHKQKFTADFYSKGTFYIKNAPKQIMGQKIEFPFPLDSTRSGIIYLSETISKIKSQQKPKEFYEKITASKVSGQDNGISFNQAKEVNFDVYQNMVNINGTNVISPISTYATNSYKYKLTGTFYTNDKQLINKIKVSPKQKGSRTFEGFIYIVEDSWAVYGTELNITGKELSTPMIEGLTIKQNFAYQPQQKSWNIILQTIDFKAGMFGIHMNGRFSASYKNYNFNPDFTKTTFTNEILSFEKNATKKTSSFWKQARPIPLTENEEQDYKVKDSIKTIRKSKKYLDSIDKIRNKISLLAPLLGYQYTNSFKKWDLNFKAPLFSVGFNTVQGWNTDLGISFNQQLNNTGKKFNIDFNANYGLAEKKWRPTGKFTFYWNYFDKPVIQISGGVKLEQFNQREPISKLYNSIATLFFEENYMKLYQKKHIGIKFAKDVANGIRLFGDIEYLKRSPVQNNTNFTFFNRENKAYTSNNPISNSSSPSFTSHKLYKAQLSTVINFGNKYITLPESKWDVGNSKYPTLSLSYRKLFGADQEQLNSDLFKARLHQNIDFESFGKFKYTVKGGFFLSRKNIAFMDYIHPNGNQLLVLDRKNDSFNLLDYYQLSTNDKQAELHLSHNFEGAILGKIPLLNKLNAHLVGGFKSIVTPGKQPYNEFSIGMDNLGVGKWRFLRVDYVWSRFEGKTNSGIVLGINVF